MTAATKMKPPARQPGEPPIGPNEEQRLDQVKLVTEYVKFHIGLYLATPPLFMVIADGLDVKSAAGWVKAIWVGAFCLMNIAFLWSGISAGIYMSRCINSQWSSSFLEDLERLTFAPRRRTIQHGLYWVGLVIGVIGLLPLLFTWVVALL